ncbi:hypothetical protein, partial [Shigella boydii]|uniref:hypothetical protein n=1 Tax=Shigella boydii TaxID=621 RepID=UPI001C0A6D8E
SSGAGRTSDGNGSHASTLKSPSYTKSVSWQHYPTLQVIYPINMRDKNIVHGIKISNKREYIPAPSLHKRCRK